MIFNLNYGPFGKGAWFAEKKQWLLEFLDACDHTSDYWLKYADKIAKAHL
jgi:hypothetical protein